MIDSGGRGRRAGGHTERPLPTPSIQYVCVLTCQPQAPDGRRLSEILRSSMQPARLEWMLNFRRFRQTLSLQEREHMAVGTTSNESLHRELNNSFDNVHRLHKSTLLLRLRIFQLSKLISHGRAMYGRSVRAARQQLVLARAVQSVSPWTAESWQDWCGRLPPGQQAELPLSRRRAADANAVREHKQRCVKRPAAAPALTRRTLLRRPAAFIATQVLRRPDAGGEPKANQKRTPFSKRRESVPSAKRARALWRKPAAST